MTQPQVVPHRKGLDEMFTRHSVAFAQPQWPRFLALFRGAISLALPPALSPSSPSFVYFELRDVKLNADGHIHTDVEGQS